MSEEAHVVILLDLAIENPIPLTVVLGCLPPGSAPARVLRLTDFDIAQSATGTPDDWPSVIVAIDRLVAAAREVEKTGARCRYWIAGRASLPVFFHLGYRLTKKAFVTLINPRDTGPLDVLGLDPPSPSSPSPAPYFMRSPWPTRASLANIRLSLLVSSRIKVSPEQVETFMASRGAPHGGLVEAHATDDLTEITVAPALRELDDTAAGIRTWYPCCVALAIFIAGPATLAFLVGRSINPHIFPDIQVFQHRNNQYQLAYETRPSHPAPRKHTILFLASNPLELREIALAREARDIQDELRRTEHRDRFDFQTRWAAQPFDLLREIRQLKPTILHFSGHGGQAGLRLENSDGSSQVISREAIAKTIEAAGPSIQVVVLNACNSESHAKELSAYVKCVVGMAGAINDSSAKSFAAGFYGGLGDGASVQAAYEQGCAAIQLESASGADQPKLEVQPGINPSKEFLA
jgi:hypothetical protein